MEFTGATVSAPFGCRALRGGGQRPLRTAGWGVDGRRRRVVSGPGTGTEQWRSWKVSCVATEKHEEKAAAGLGVDFADEEDYVKGGGGELLYVQMQATKAMESQSKIAYKLLPIADETSVLDVVIIGCGPAGLSLAAESAKKGLTVGLIGPDLPFTNNYGVWEDEFKDLGLESCIEHVWKDTVVYLDNNKPIMIGRAYGRVHRDLLHEELPRLASGPPAWGGAVAQDGAPSGGAGLRGGGPGPRWWLLAAVVVRAARRPGSGSSTPSAAPSVAATPAARRWSSLLRIDDGELRPPVEMVFSGQGVGSSW